MDRNTLPRKVTLEEVKEWRLSRHEAGLPSGLQDFFTYNGICFKCKGSGEMTIPNGAAMPSVVKCGGCGGTGKTDWATG